MYENIVLPIQLDGKEPDRGYIDSIIETLGLTEKLNNLPSKLSEAVGRKNWLFSNTANGAKCSTALYSIVATAQANGLDAKRFLTELFSRPAGTILLPFDT